MLNTHTIGRNLPSISLNGRHTRNLFQNRNYTSVFGDEPYQIEPVQNAPSNFVLHFVSDTHLDNHKINNISPYLLVDNPERIHFRKWLTDLNNECKKNEKKSQATLVLLGDIFDFTASWNEDAFPFDDAGNFTEEKTKRIFHEIFSNNHFIIKELRNFLELSKNTRVIFVVGNHDSVLVKPSIQKQVRETLLPVDSDNEREKKIIFSSAVEFKKIGLYAEHGQRLDPSAYSDGSFLNKCDVYELQLNRLIRKTVSEFEGLRNIEPHEEDLISNIRRMEYVHPISNMLPYISHIGRNNISSSQGLSETFRRELASLLSESISYVPYVGRISNLPVAGRMVKQALGRQRIQSILMNLISSFDESSNIRQIREAERLHKEQNISFFIAGHTHLPQDITNGVRYINLGKWKPDIVSDPRHSTPIWKQHFPMGHLRLETNLNNLSQTPKIVFSNGFINL